MDAISLTLTAGQSDTRTIFESGSARKVRFTVFNAASGKMDTNVYIKINEGGTEFIIDRFSIPAGNSRLWSGTLGADDSVIVTSENNYEKSFLYTEDGTILTTEAGESIGNDNIMQVNYYVAQE